MDNWLASITAWLVGLVQSVFTTLVSWLHDAVLWVWDGVLSGLAGLIAAIPVPSFLASGVNIGSIFSGYPPFALYLVSQMGLGQCFAVISAGVAFRLTRKLLTLGQW